MGLEPESQKKYKKFSLGMKQRLGIACAVMEQPDIVILDEPTNSLDSDGVKTLKDVVYSEKERGALVILSCHDKSVLEGLADEILLLEDGKAVSYSAVDEGERE